MSEFRMRGEHQRNSCDRAPLADEQRRADQRKEKTGIDRMAHSSVRPRLNQLVIDFQRDPRTPELSQMPACPDGDRQARDHKNQE